jgi:hypothetical protein
MSCDTGFDGNHGLIPNKLPTAGIGRRPETRADDAPASLWGTKLSKLPNLSYEWPPRWLPDWRNASGYPDPDAPKGTTACARWRWEFLRRSRQYRSDWAERTARPPEFWRAQYLLMDPVDPASPRASFIGPVLYWCRPLARGDQTLTIQQRAGTALIQVDLTLPLQPQFKSAEFALRPYTLDEVDLKRAKIEAGFFVMSNRRKGYQWKPVDWLRYLRLLDADSTGASTDEIGRILHPGKQNAPGSRELSYLLRNDRLAARRLCDGRYRLIM